MATQPDADAPIGFIAEFYSDLDSEWRQMSPGKHWRTERGATAFMKRWSVDASVQAYRPVTRVSKLVRHGSAVVVQP